MMLEDTKLRVCDAFLRKTSRASETSLELEPDEEVEVVGAETRAAAAKISLLISQRQI